MAVVVIPHLQLGSRCSGRLVGEGAVVVGIRLRGRAHVRWMEWIPLDALSAGGKPCVRWAIARPNRTASKLKKLISFCKITMRAWITASVTFLDELGSALFSRSYF